MRGLGLGLFVAVVGCVVPEPADPGRPSGYPTSVPEKVEPAFVRVSIIGALIAPSKTDGRTWDGPGRVPIETTNKVVSALAAANPYAAVAGVVANLAMSTLDKPDPYGYAELLGPGLAGSVELPMSYIDTLTPSWQGADFIQVPLRSGARIRITLIDKDLSHDDPIGTVELSNRDLREALEAGNIVPVRVAEQSNSQILFINVSVAAE
jgi:hypothetical protein